MKAGMAREAGVQGPPDDSCGGFHEDLAPALLPPPATSFHPPRTLPGKFVQPFSRVDTHSRASYVEREEKQRRHLAYGAVPASSGVQSMRPLRGLCGARRHRGPEPALCAIAFNNHGTAGSTPFVAGAPGVYSPILPLPTSNEQRRAACTGGQAQQRGAIAASGGLRYLCCPRSAEQQHRGMATDEAAAAAETAAETAAIPEAAVSHGAGRLRGRASGSQPGMGGRRRSTHLDFPKDEPSGGLAADQVGIWKAAGGRPGGAAAGRGAGAAGTHVRQPQLLGHHVRHRRSRGCDSVAVCVQEQVRLSGCCCRQQPRIRPGSLQRRAAAVAAPHSGTKF